MQVGAAPLAVAHRTPPTAAAAAQLHAAGADVFEVDLRLIADELVVTHFLPVVRAVPHLQHDGVRLRFGRRDPLAQTLAAAAGVVPADAAILLDLKDDRGADSLALARRLCADLVDRSRYLVSSKDWAALTLLAGEGFAVWRTVGDERRLRRLLDEGPGDAAAVTIRRTLLRRAGTRAALDLARVVAWTVNDPAEAAVLLDHGVGGITTDNPAVLRLVGARRDA